MQYAVSEIQNLNPQQMGEVYAGRLAVFVCRGDSQDGFLYRSVTPYGESILEIPVVLAAVSVVTTVPLSSVLIIVG